MFHRHARLEAGEKVEPGVALVIQRVPGGRDGGLHHDWDPGGGRDAGIGAFEIGAGNANHRERGSIQPDSGADDVFLSAEMIQPGVVLQDGHGMTVAELVVFGREEAA